MYRFLNTEPAEVDSIVVQCATELQRDKWLNVIVGQVSIFATPFRIKFTPVGLDLTTRFSSC
jgi:hypothetical protein